MTVVACLLAASLIAGIWLFLRHLTVLEAKWAVERRELLNRIQRPEQIPVSDRPDFVIPELEPDFSHLVGTIADEPPQEG